MQDTPTNQILQGDCLDALKSLASKSVGHVITDPPYSKHVHGNRVRGGMEQNREARVDMGFEYITNKQRTKLARELTRVCSGWILVFCPDEETHLWRQALCDHLRSKRPDVCVRCGGDYEKGPCPQAAVYRRNCVWVKPNAMPKVVGDGPAQGHESIVTVWAGTGGSVWNGGGRVGVFTYPSGRNVYHPTEKPLTLMRDLILTFSQPGDLILDPYAGSGSTLVAAKETGRRWLGYELQEKHLAAAKHRVESCRTRLPFEMRFMTSNKTKDKAFGEAGRKVKRPSLLEG